jgi:two-component system, cell cycle sensor histidine kinase and response regulator CckA
LPHTFKSLSATEHPPVNEVCVALALLVSTGMTASFEAVLVVDDDAACCQSVAQTLIKAGYRTEATTDPLDGLWRLMHNRYGLVIADLHMPGLSGTRLIAQLRRISPTTPAVLMSGFPDARARAEADELNAWVLCKPIGIETLLDTVGRLLGNPREARAAS